MRTNCRRHQGRSEADGSASLRVGKVCGAHLHGMKTTTRNAGEHSTLPVTGYYSPEQAAEMLGVSVHTLEKWRRAGNEGIGPRYRLHGRHVRYDPRDLLAWSESRVVA